VFSFVCSWVSRLFVWLLVCSFCCSLPIPGNSGRSSRKISQTTEFLTCLQSPRGLPDVGNTRQLVEAIHGNPRITDSNSRNAVSFSCARTTKRFPSPRCASAIQLVRPLEAIAETQPKLQPRFLRLSAIISQYFTRDVVYLELIADAGRINSRPA
jgi:hypothetical protein